MAYDEIEFTTEELAGLALNGLAYLISPVLLIWALNTLFGLGIEWGVKSWLAGLVLIVLVRFHTRGPGRFLDPAEEFEEEEYEDDAFEEEEDEEYEDADASGNRDGSGKLIAYHEAVRRRNPPPEGPFDD